MTQTETSSTQTIEEIESGITREAMARLVPLWKHMTGIYQHKWTSGVGERVHPTWVIGLADMTDAEIAIGIRACVLEAEQKKRAGDEDWPPTLGEFRVLCRPTPYPYRNNVPTLPAPKLTDEQKAQRHQDILGMKKMLRQVGQEQEEARRNRLREIWLKAKMPLAEMLADREPGQDDDIE